MMGWIEVADERQVCEAAAFDRPTASTEIQRLHFGATILNLPSRIMGALSGHSDRPDDQSRAS